MGVLDAEVLRWTPDDGIDSVSKHNPRWRGGLRSYDDIDSKHSLKGHFVFLALT